MAFRQRDAAGALLRQGPPEVAAALGLGVARAERLLKAAMRAVPLAGDPEPVESCYEDGDLLAVNKPPGVITAPKHRRVGVPQLQLCLPCMELQGGFQRNALSPAALSAHQ